MSGGFFRGTTIEQDQRFGNAHEKLLREQTFSSVLKKRVDISKVNMEVIKPWVSSKIHELLQIDDEVLYSYIVNMLEESDTPDPKAMQVSLTGFLEDKTQGFMESLWLVLVEAQESPGGIPESFVRRKMEELRAGREEKERIRERIREAERRSQRMEDEGGGRRTRAGRRSRWDAPASGGRDDRREGRSKSRESISRGRSRSRERNSRRERSRSRERDTRRERSRSRERDTRRERIRSRERNTRRERSRSPGRRSYDGRRDNVYRRRGSRSPSSPRRRS